MNSEQDEESLSTEFRSYGGKQPERELERSFPRLEVEDAVAHAFGIAAMDLRSATRGRARAAFARQAAMYLAHVACSLTYTDVGRIFARDRTTVAHGCGLVEDRRDDPHFDRAMELLERVVVTLMAGGRARDFC